MNRHNWLRRTLAGFGWSTYALLLALVFLINSVWFAGGFSASSGVLLKFGISPAGRTIHMAEPISIAISLVANITTMILLYATDNPNRVITFSGLAGSVFGTKIISLMFFLVAALGSMHFA
jgi:hypothetical protein